MVKKIVKVLLLMTLVFSLAMPSNVDAAKNNKVMWGKTELKVGQIGKVTILQTISLSKLESNGDFTKARELKKGEEFRVYSYRQGFYGVGGGMYLPKHDVKVKYETPSKSKLALLNGANTPVVSKPTPKPNPVVAKDKNAIFIDKIKTFKATNYKSFKEYGEALYTLEKELAKESFTGKEQREQEIKDLYFNHSIKVNELEFKFNNGTNLLVFKIPSESNRDKNTILFNNEFHLSIPITRLILNASTDMYIIDPADESGYQGKFFGTGSMYNFGKDGAYSTVYMKNDLTSEILFISEKDYPWAGQGTGGFMANTLNPFTVNEVESKLGIDYEVSYDRSSGKLTVHFNKPSK